jgi:serine/threonine-protein kinase HipA
MAMTGSERFFVYLQQPDTGAWVTVGRYRREPGGAVGVFEYAPSYLEAGLAWSIDPVNLPCVPGRLEPAARYGGLHDALRDACPDAWGQSVLRREHGLPEGAPLVRYLLLAGNDERWGALAVGASARPAGSRLRAPRLTELADLVRELRAMAQGRPALTPRLRRRLVQSASVGGARPKASVRDEDGQVWLVKPRLSTDTADIPGLEHAAQRWGAGSGLSFAPTVLHPDEEASALRVLRFDREADRRLMCVSAASLLQAEYPGGSPLERARWSYPRLAEELQRIGAPREDRLELFGRMIFNAVCGNDDDHPRNHAVVYRQAERRWRLSPAFDVVPNPWERPTHLAMHVAAGGPAIGREALLADAPRFGFEDRASAGRHLDALLLRVAHAFEPAVAALEADWRDRLRARLRAALALLGDPLSRR